MNITIGGLLDSTHTTHKNVVHAYHLWYALHQNIVYHGVIMTIKKYPQKKKTNGNKNNNSVKKSAHVKFEEDFGYKKPLLPAYPTAPETVNAMADHVLAWSLEEDALTYQQYANKEGICYEDFKNIMARTDYAKNAWTIAKQRIATRRELGGLTFKLNSSVMMPTLPLYNPEYKEYLKEKDEHKIRLQAQLVAEEKPKQTIVVLEKFPSSDLVPVKKVTKED